MTVAPALRVHAPSSGASGPVPQPAPAAPRTTGFWTWLREYDERPALTVPGSGGRPARTMTYAELADRVDELAARLGSTRRLVLLAGANTVDAVVGYLAALAGGHPTILLPGDNPSNLRALVDAYDPDAVIGAAGRLRERREGSAHELHPDLALLLSTSGTTGSPKLVRLSHENLDANAQSIATYLGIRPTDVAATTLPMHYCYGLSVINSHLARGASLLLTDHSVVDECFWQAVRSHEVTTFAGVPYTFDLLDRVGFAGMELPSLRYLTQAGGRLAPDRVRGYAELGRRRGWDLMVMYGQTEATARMAYLPPELARASPSAIGVPIPGGSFHLEPLPEAPLRHVAAGQAAAPESDDSADADAALHSVEVGELVYTGANVMLGYASTPSDLARGRDIEVLRTGDVARRTPEGLYEIIGRRSRIAKVFGLRIDLDQVERVYDGEGHLVHCADGDDRLVVAVDTSARPATDVALHAVAKEHFGLPPRAVQVLTLSEVPRLPTGKPDYRSILTLARADRRRAATGRSGAAGAGTGTDAARLTALFGEVLGRDDVSESDTFVTLEGDSLSYVEMSVRLEQALGRLPVNWHVTPIGALAAHTRAAEDPPRRGRTLETNVLLRALAIVMIVGSHANLFVAVGGAHVLLGVAGFNFGRFHLTGADRTDRVRHLVTSITRVVIPSVVWLGAVAVLTGQHGWTTVLLLNGLLGPPDWAEPQWWYWFVEALVYTLVVLTALMAVPWVDRLERRWSFWLPFGLALVGLATRYDLVSLMPGDEIHRAHVIFWLFALGWATVKSTRWWQRALVSAVVVGTVPGFFEDPAREAIVVAGMLALVWLRALRVPSWLARASGVLAGASLYIYLAHWQIYPHLEDRFPLAATVLSLLGGVAFWQLATRVSLPPRWWSAVRRPAWTASSRADAAPSRSATAR